MIWYANQKKIQMGYPYLSVSQTRIYNKRLILGLNINNILTRYKKAKINRGQLLKNYVQSRQTILAIQMEIA